MSTLRVDNLRGQTADGTNRYVVQIKETSLSSDFTVNSTSEAEVLSLAITPQLSTNKVLVMAYFGMYIDGGASTSRGDFVLKRDSTQIHTTDSDLGGFGFFRESSGHFKANNNFLSIIDSPSTTSSVTYKMFVDGNTLSSNGSLGAGITRLTLMEIAQ